MARNLFSKLKRYSGGIISQDENYATEALATLLDEFPSVRMFLIRELFHIPGELEAIVRTQVPYETKRFGRAIIDLVIEDRSNLIMVEVKVESGLNYYEVDQETYNQIAKYEDCEGLPLDKEIYIFVLSKYPMYLESSDYKYFKLDSNPILWRTLYTTADRYCRSLAADTPEKYLLAKFTDYLKEEGMAGFQGFKIDHLADLSRQPELGDVCAEHRRTILENIDISGFEGKEDTSWDRDGVYYRCVQEGRSRVAVFVGLWLSPRYYHIEFPLETGPQVMVFVEVPPKHELRDQLLSSKAYREASKKFTQPKQNLGFQVLLRHKPLAEFLGSKDQVNSLLEFYRESIHYLEESGLLNEIR